MEVKVTTITDVRPHGDNLSIVSVDGHEVVANRLEDGSFRWKTGEECVYVPENAILPEDVLQERGYWNAEKGKGLLGGSKGNRVKMQRFAGHESRGLLFKTSRGGFLVGIPGAHDLVIRRGNNLRPVQIGDEVGDFFDVKEYVPE